MFHSSIAGGVGGGGVGDSHIKTTGVLVANLEKKPKRYQDHVLWAWLEKFFILLRRYHF